MKLENTVRIPAAPDRVFAAINDVERVVTCLPGAAITGRDGDSYRGGITVKVGPIRAAYSGTVEFLNIDSDQRHLTLSGRAADTHGSGDAQAHVTLAVEPTPDGSLLRVNTDLVLSGKIVAFGKGAIVAVSNKLMEQFASNLAAQLDDRATPQQGVPASANGSVDSHRVTPTPASRDTGLDVMSLLPPGAARRSGYVAAFLFGVFEGWLISRAFRKV